MSCTQNLLWPEPVVRVQSLSESGINSIPSRYVKPPHARPDITQFHDHHVNIPVIDYANLFSHDPALRHHTLRTVSSACRDWGFFQLVNHGVDHRLMARIREMWRDFFNLPLEEKQEYANAPDTYEGYGSRLGVEKNAILDWSDYFFLHYLPVTVSDKSKWPAVSPSCRELIEEYARELVKVCEGLMKVLSITLGLEEDYLQNAFGGAENIGACLRANFYPKCPQPDLTLGISPHSDPGGITLLLADDNVTGLQVRNSGRWVSVKPISNSFIVNVGDQIQVLSNAIYKSVEHRVVVNSMKERESLAFFYNPKSNLRIEPAKQLVTKERPAQYQPMTYDEYRLYIRSKGLHGKTQVESLKSNR